MNIIKSLGVCLLSVLVLSACAELQAYNRPRSAPVVSSESTADAWLSELHATRGMFPYQLQQTLALRELEYRNYPGVNNRLRLILLLAVGEEPVRDQARARKLLAETNPHPEDPGARELLGILRQFLGEQQQAEQKIIDLNRQLTKQNQRIDELEQQQRALTTIEQNIQQRDNPVESEDGN